MAYRHEAPVFCDRELRQWISWMDQYFDRTPLMEFGKITVARRSLRGEAERYINELDSFRPFRNWKEMKHKLVLKFGADDDPEKIRLRIESARGYRYSWNRDPWESFVESRSKDQQTHLSEVDSQIQSMDSRLSGFEQRMDARLSRMDARIDSKFQASLTKLKKQPLQSQPAEQAPIMADQRYSPSQVHHRTQEQHPEALPLGYRPGNSNFANHDTMSHENVLPMFDGTNPTCWIVKADRYFRFMDDAAKLVLVCLRLDGAAFKWLEWVLDHGGFRDWADFKKQLLDRFGQVTSCSPVEMIVKDEEVSQKDQEIEVVMQETNMMKKTASLTVETISVNDLGCPVTACFPTVVNPNESIPEIVQELDTMLKKDSCLAHDDEADVSLEQELQITTVSYLETECVSQPQETEYSLVVDSFVASHLGENESMLVLQQIESPILEGKQLMSQRLNVVAVEEREEMPRYWSDILKPAIADETCKHSSDETEENVQLSQNWTITSKPYCAYQHVTRKARKVTRKHKQKKFYKTWTFKFKEKLRVQKLRDASIAQPYPLHVQKLVDVMFQVKHKWRSKLLTPASVLAFVLKQAAGLRTALQPSGFCHSGYLLISISLSLWSSLISRAGVYKGKLACCLIVDAVIWLLLPTSESDILEKDVGKQRKKEELSTYGMVQVVNHQLLKEKGSLLIHSKRHLLHILIHQTNAWRKFYKTRMFKYKAGVSQVQVLL